MGEVKKCKSYKRKICISLTFTHAKKRKHKARKDSEKILWRVGDMGMTFYRK